MGKPYFPLLVVIGLVGLFFVSMARFDVSRAAEKAAPANMIFVNTTLDLGPFDGGLCSLREAIQAANDNVAVDGCPAGSSTAVDIISFAVNGTFTLIIEDMHGAVGLNIKENLIIQGNGTGSTIIEPHPNVSKGSIIYATANAREVTLNDLTVRGWASDGPFSGTAFVYTPAIKGRFTTDESVTYQMFLNRVTIEGHEGGEAILVPGGSVLEANEGVVRNNKGGIVSEHRSAVILRGMVVTHNEHWESNLRKSGSGVLAKGSLEIYDSFILYNSAGYGGGIYACPIDDDDHVLIRETLINSNEASGSKFGGGGIFTCGEVTIENSQISYNTALGDPEVDIVGEGGFGGGIYNAGILTLRNSDVVANHSFPLGHEEAAGGGGGIFNGGECADCVPTLNVQKSYIAFNKVTPPAACVSWAGGGGGIYNKGVGQISDTVVGSNTALGIAPVNCGTNKNLAHGGAIYNAPATTLAIYDSYFSFNESPDTAGGIFNGGELTIFNSQFTSNRVVNSFGDGFGAGAIYNFGQLSLERTTLNENVADGTVAGGGALVNYGSAQILNATISGNSADNTRGGGGVHNQGLLSIYNSTIAYNSAAAAERGGSGILWSYQAGHNVQISNSIVAYNSGAPNCTNWAADNDPPPFVSQGHNLEELNSCGFDQSTDLPNTAVGLLPLQDNGGVGAPAIPPFTHGILGTPANDAGDCSGGIALTDQRGIVRPQDSACDIGAYEYRSCPTADAPTDLVISRSGERTLEFNWTLPSRSSGFVLWTDTVPYRLPHIDAGSRWVASPETPPVQLTTRRSEVNEGIFYLLQSIGDCGTLSRNGSNQVGVFNFDLSSGR